MLERGLGRLVRGAGLVTEGSFYLTGYSLGLLSLLLGGKGVSSARRSVSASTPAEGHLVDGIRRALVGYLFDVAPLTDTRGWLGELSIQLKDCALALEAPLDSEIRRAA